MSISVNNVFQNNFKVFNPKGGSYPGYLFAQKPDTFTLSFKGNPAHTQVVEALKLTNANAEVAFNGQVASDGWAGKTAESSWLRSDPPSATPAMCAPSAPHE